MIRPINELGIAGLSGFDLSDLTDKQLQTVRTLRESARSLPKWKNVEYQTITFQEYKSKQAQLEEIKSVTVLGSPSINSYQPMKKMYKCNVCDIHGWGKVVMTDHLLTAHNIKHSKALSYYPVEDFEPSLVNGVKSKYAYACQYCGDLWWGSGDIRKHTLQCFKRIWAKNITVVDECVVKATHRKRK